MKRIAALLSLCSLMSCARSSSPDSVFSDFSIGVPEYQRIETFNHPADAVKGDYFSMEFTQSATQFYKFISKLGVAETNVLSSAGASHVAVASKINPNYPWFLSLKAEAVDGREKTYRVHVEGQQPYD